MNTCVCGIWDDVKLEVPEPNSSLLERDQIAYIHGVLSAQKNRRSNPYTPDTSLHTQFDLGFKIAYKAKGIRNKKIKAEQAKLKRKQLHV